ncbi:hypothetical protein AWH48_13460 [Domibacillus aminovorans]|uniref:Integrase catalytic domain-containing protein n=1 Tax=Domibacillus aminovorans TaxID=29332 RepID=A0A177KI69_9BACI|nr:hypothetical protein AWH48_13460 [Domibacillus aminovorans]
MPFIESFHSSLKLEGFYTLKRESLLYFKVVQRINQYIHSFHHSEPRVVTVDKNRTYPIAVEELRKEKRGH